jgi:hypothetical protein
MSEENEEMRVLGSNFPWRTSCPVQSGAAGPAKQDLTGAFWRFKKIQTHFLHKVPGSMGDEGIQKILFPVW